MSTLRSLSELFEREIHLVNNDVTPVMSLNAKSIRGASDIIVDVHIRDRSSWLSQGQIKKLSKKNRQRVEDIFIDTLYFIKNDLTKHQHWSFWHYAGLCLITCFAYERLCLQGKHSSIDLSLDETWANLDWEAGILAINFFSAKLYKGAMIKLHSMNTGPNGDIKDMCEWIQKRIKILHGQ